MTSRLLLTVATLLTLTLAAPAVALPPAPPEAVAGRLGQYGTADNILTVYESGGRLFADGRGLKQPPLTPTGPGRYRADMSQI